MEHGYTGIPLTTDEINDLEPFNDEACIDFLESLLDELDDSMHEGITKQVISKGYDSLSDKQKMVFKNYILKPVLVKCGRCEEFLWEEANYIHENGLCTYCQKMWDND